MNPAHTSQFAAHRDVLAEALAWVEACCAALPAEDRRRVGLVIEELFCNSLHHGYGGDSGQPVWLGLEVAATGCRLRYEDQAPPYDPFRQAPAALIGADVEDRPIGGLGVHLVVQLSTWRRYRRQGDRNCIDLYVEARGAEAPAPASPCVRNCCLDDRDVCLGCGRHVDEITGWHHASVAEREAILARAAQRRAARGR